MWKEATLLAVGCVLFVSMGLSEEIQLRLGFRAKLLSCPKCLCFWVTMLYLLVSGCRVVTAVCASFLYSYFALWADLGLSILNKKYNEFVKQISAQKATEANANKKRSKASKDCKHRPGVSSMRNKR